MLPCPSAGDLPDPGAETTVSTALAGGFVGSASGKPGGGRGQALRESRTHVCATARVPGSAPCVSGSADTWGDPRTCLGVPPLSSAFRAESSRFGPLVWLRSPCSQSLALYLAPLFARLRRGRASPQPVSAFRAGLAVRSFLVSPCQARKDHRKYFRSGAALILSNFIYKRMVSVGGRGREQGWRREGRGGKRRCEAQGG